MSETLAGHARVLADTTLIDLFDRDPGRAAQLALDWGDWHVDFSKERVTPAALAALVAHAESIGVRPWLDALFAGERVNLSEERPALHTALRRTADTPMRVAGEDVMPAIRETQERMRAMSETLRAGAWRGATGRTMRTVVNLGIGGSDLGPRFVTDALVAGDESPIDVAFVSNVDPEAMARTLAALDPATTLFIVTSKTFTTQETLANAAAARAWLSRRLAVDDVSAHFIAVTANIANARAFGIPETQLLPMWDWVGGRYSLWSAVGLPIACAHGYATFSALLEGAAAMDEHVALAPTERNLAIVLALIGWWNARWLGAPQRLIIPYAHALRELPAYLQQLFLESNGKRVTRDGMPLEATSTPSLWGGSGTDVQHSFFQWLHQGTYPTPVEFIVPVCARHPLGEQQALLVANALAQAQALLVGRSADLVRRELASRGLSSSALESAIAARVCPGNRASTTLLVPRVDAWNVGALLALYEHRTYVESLLFGVNAFDQWGVELGKTLAGPIARALIDDAPLPAGTDASTRLLVDRVQKLARSGPGSNSR